MKLATSKLFSQSQRASERLCVCVAVGGGPTARLGLTCPHTAAPPLAPDS
jgi:hypothetical protein